MGMPELSLDAGGGGAGAGGELAAVIVNGARRGWGRVRARLMELTEMELTESGSNSPGTAGSGDGGVVLWELLTGRGLHSSTFQLNLSRF